MLVSWVRRADDAVFKAENAFLAAALAAILFLMLATIVARYVVNAPITWSEEALLIAFVWAIFVGASAAFRHRAHMRVDLLLLYAPRWLRLVLAVAGLAVVFAVLGALAHAMLGYAQAIGPNATPLLGFPVRYMLGVVPLAMATSALHLIRHIVDDGVETALASATEFAPQE
ncbi:MAG: TRAP transporter small permease [Tagaea sp.]|nr:TRAP transporter small permease [Tagaea sp.]